MKNRIKQIRNSIPEYGKTQESFAEYLGISKSNLASYEAGRRTPSDAVVRLMCEKCNVNYEWLKDGTGKMLKEKDGSFTELLSDLDDSDDDFIKSLIKVYMGLDKDSKDALRKIADCMAEEYKDMKSTVPVANHKLLQTIQEPLNSQTATKQEKMEAYQEYLDEKEKKQRKAN